MILLKIFFENKVLLISNKMIYEFFSYVLHFAKTFCSRSHDYLQMLKIFLSFIALSRLAFFKDPVSKHKF